MLSSWWVALLTGLGLWVGGVYGVSGQSYEISSRAFFVAYQYSKTHLREPPNIIESLCYALHILSVILKSLQVAGRVMNN